MTLLSEEQKKKLQNLFSEQKFSELELEIEAISDFKTRSPFLANLLGVAKLKKESKTEQDWVDARNLFLDSYQKAPNYDDALCNYAHVSVVLRDYAHAFRELLKRKEKNYNPKINEALARIYFFEGEIDKEVDLFKENEKNDHLTATTASHLLVSMNYSSNFDQNDYLNYCKKIDKKFSFSEEELNKLNRSGLNNELTIGFISPDFKEHSVYYFLKSTLKSFKDRKIKILAFNLRKKNELDEKSYELKEEFDEWIDLSELNDLQAANLIIDKKVSILIDIAGHFARNRFRILKYKPSPVQISWMGFVNTTGIKEIDYLIADNNLIPKKEEHLYTEKILRLPKIWNCHSGFNEDLNISEPPLLKNNFLTFGCFNNSTKISEKCIIVWSKILSKIKNSKIVIKAQSEDSEIAHKKIIDKFKLNNIDENRIIVKKYQKERSDHLKMYELIDISLDTFPYPGVTTSFESIWMGVPVLTMKGFNFVSRCGESININLDMKEFLAENEEDYILKAVEFSKNPKKIIEIRKTLRDRALNSPLFDKKMFGKEFCELIENTWKNYNKK